MLSRPLRAPEAQSAQGRIAGHGPVGVIDIGSNSVRLVVYERSTKPLIDYYSAKGLLHTINGDADVDMVDAAIRAVIDP